MKHLVLTIFVVINAGNLIAQSSKPDTLVNAIWDGTTWQNHSRIINNYDEDCRLKTALNQNWDVATSKWADHTISMYSYVSGDYVSEILTQLWLNNSWINNYRQTYAYDVSFKTLNTVVQTWSLDHWSNYTATSYTYDTYGYIDSVLTQLSYNDIPFQNNSLSINIHNSDGALEQTINQNWNNTTTSWNNYSKKSFIYNTRKTIDTAITSLWNQSTGLWQFNTQSVYTYTGTGKLFFYINQDWQTSQWVNHWQYTNSYDNYGFVSNVSGEIWDGFDFEKYNQNTYKNNSDGTINQHVTQYWSTTINNWVNSNRATYSYSASCVLPLKLLLFTATKTNNKVNLNWQAADEINSSHFTIQRSFNGADFTSLGDISARSTAGISSYEYAENIEKITSDRIYYRLKIFDKDGSYTYSKIVPVALTAYTGSLKVYPNPAKDQLFVLYKMQNTNKAELRITDMSGKIIYSNTVSKNQDTGLAGINISSLSKGMYYVLMITDNDIQRTQFLKQ